MNKFLSKVESVLCKPWLNVPLTLYLNFRLCKFKDAIHLPLFFYGRVMLDCTMGSFCFPNGSRRGAVKFGRIRGHFQAPKGKIFLCLKENSKVIVNSYCFISIDTSIRLTEGATLEIGDAVRIGDGVKIMADNKIIIGDNSAITFGSQIIDTNFHYILNLETNEVPRKDAPVIIGSNNWIGNHSTIMKGTQTPDWCIIASHSLLNKNYGNTSYMLLAGIPAKVVGYNKKRIYDLDKEASLDTYFNNHKESYVYNENN